jgi:hypothetical protein
MLSFAFLPQLTQHVLEVPIPFNAYCIYAILYVLLLVTKKNVPVLLMQSLLFQVSEVYSKEFKGAISALASLQGHLLIASGPLSVFMDT